MLNNRSMPRATVIPVLPFPDVEKAIAWLTAAFGFTLRLQIGSHRAQLNAGDGAVLVTNGPPAPAAVMMRVEDLEAHHDRAVKNGARIVQGPASQPYGERQCTAKDLAGHRWTFSQSIADVAPEQWGGTSGEG